MDKLVIEGKKIRILYFMTKNFFNIIFFLCFTIDNSDSKLYTKIRCLIQIILRENRLRILKSVVKCYNIIRQGGGLAGDRRWKNTNTLFLWPKTFLRPIFLYTSVDNRETKLYTKICCLIQIFSRENQF